jgi:hypothetical protein
LSISVHRVTKPAHAVGVTVREALFKAIVTDLETLRDAYSRAGLLTDGGQGSPAYTLLGGGEAADRFRRDILLLDAVVRNRVACLVFNRHGSRHVVVFGGNNVGKSTVVNPCRGLDRRHQP